jgi:RNA polymerase sigma factor (sigma-70 family)
VSPEGFAAFFRERYPRTVLLLMTMGAARADAEDAVQEAMTLAWQQRESVREPAAWVRTTAVRAWWKRDRRQPRTRPLDDTTPHPALGDDGDLVIFAEEQQRVVRLLRALPPAQRTVAALYYDGLAVSEIAGLTGKPAATIRSHLRHVRRSLQEVIVSDRP